MPTHKEFKYKSVIHDNNRTRGSFDVFIVDMVDAEDQLTKQSYKKFVRTEVTNGTFDFGGILKGKELGDMVGKISDLAITANTKHKPTDLVSLNV
jgi:hypothetical protein